MANTKKIIMLSSIEDIQAAYGRSVIIFRENDRHVFRLSTRRGETAKASVSELQLPNFGKMNKFIIMSDNKTVKRLVPTDEYLGATDYVKHEIGDTVNIDPTILLQEFEKETWNDAAKRIKLAQLKEAKNNKSQKEDK